VSPEGGERGLFVPIGNDMTHLVGKSSLSSTALQLITAILIFFAILCVLSVSADKVVIYFYSSETSVNNFKSLKMEFDRYLSKFGPYEFQPFSGREAFETHVKGKDRCLLLLSSWHYLQIRREYDLAPVLIGLRDGKKYQKRVLVAGAGASGIDAFKSERIASASTAQHTDSVLRDMLKEKYAADFFRILTVPKDIDALMSVGFGMSKLALSTTSCLEELKKVNPKLCEKMNVMAEGEESLLLIVAVPKGFAEGSREMVGIIEGMSRDPDGKQNIRMLGLDGWQGLDPSEKSKLET
jgi:hypothetical protein